MNITIFLWSKFLLLHIYCKKMKFHIEWLNNIAVFSG